MVRAEHKQNNYSTKSKRTIGIILFHIVVRGGSKGMSRGWRTMLKGLQLMTGKQIFINIFLGSILSSCEDYSDNTKLLYTLIIIFSYGIKIYILGSFFYMWVCNITIFTFLNECHGKIWKYEYCMCGWMN